MMIAKLWHRMFTGVAMFLLVGGMNAVTVRAGTATLSWDPPSTNEDGTQLMDLAGYKVYYGTSPGSYSSTIDVGNRITYQVAGLADGITYYFVITAYNIYGNESGYSQAVSKTMPLPQYALTVSKSGSGAGTVTSSPNGISCGSACSAPFAAGTVVTLTAAPDVSSVFSGWSGACTGSGTCSVTMDAARSVTANFSLKTYAITANAGTGGNISPSGTVTANHGSNGTFTITPLAGYAIANVLVDGVSAGAVGTYTFTNITANHTINAAFAVIAYALTVSKTGSGAGSVTSSPNSISCGSACSAPFAAGTVVTLTAAPDASSVFSGWSGACTGAGICFVTMDTAKTVYPLFSLKPLFSMSCMDAGIPCVERVGGGSDVDNLVNGKPGADVEYEFRVTVKDTGGTPQSVSLLTAQRSAPQFGDLVSYPLSCAGDFGIGALCTFRTKLGPAAVHRYCFEATMSDGATVRRYPETGYLSGPTVSLLNGYNIVGAPRNFGAANLDGLAAFGSSSTYRWQPELRYYTRVTTSAPAKAGEGYYSYRIATTLPELAGYPDLQANENVWPVKPGWNIISSPYAKSVRLADIRVQRGTAAPVTWQEATVNGWITNALYAYRGGDWGGTYGWESDDTAVLVPWMGYALYLKASDTSYSLIIPKP